MCLSASPGSKNHKKEKEKESKMHPNSKVGLAPKSAIQYFSSADRHFQSAKWHTIGLRPEGIGVSLKHIIFNFLAIRTRPSSYYDCLSYIFEPSSLYK